MSQSILIRNAKLLDPKNSINKPGDLLIRDGKITTIDEPGQIPDHLAEELVEANEALLIPGAIDLNSHLREPGHEYRETIESGTRAAVSGGYTAVACMPTTSPVNDNPYVTAFMLERARKSALCRVYPVGAISKGGQGEELAEIGGMIEEGAVAISELGRSPANSYLIRKAMDYVKSFGKGYFSHPEDEYLVGNGVINEGPLSNELGLRGIPSEAEEMGVSRMISLCKLTGCAVHLKNISVTESIRLIRGAKESGLPITAEVTAHHLILTEEVVRSYDTRFKVFPPLRSEEDRESLIDALGDGTIDAIATDHQPFSSEEKALEFDAAESGTIGLQTTLPATFELVTEGLISPSRWVEAISTRPAEILGVSSGEIKLGGQADFTLIHPNQTWEWNEEVNLSKSRNSCFFGRTFQPKVTATIVGGNLVHRES